MTASQAEGGGARVATRQQQRGLATRAAAVREGTAVGRAGGDAAAAATPRAQLGAAAAPRTRSRAGSLTKPPLVKTRGQPNRVTATPPPPHVADSLATNSSSPGRTRSAQSATRASAQQQQATPTAGQDKEMHNTRFAQQRRPASTTPSATATAAVATPVSSQIPAADKADAPVSASTRAAEKANNNNKSYPIPANAPPGYRPASAKPPMTRVPTFPLVEAYVPDTDSQERRHPRQLLPDDLGFPTAVMQGRIKRDDLDDKLLMATCAVLHAFENRALCPKEIAEVMLERDWLKNAYVMPGSAVESSRVPLTPARARASSTSITVARPLSLTSRPVSVHTSRARLRPHRPTRPCSCRSNSSARSRSRRCVRSDFTPSNVRRSRGARCGT